MSNSILSALSPIVSPADDDVVYLVHVSATGASRSRKITIANLRAASAGNATSLRGRTISTASPSDNQVMVWDTATSQWVPEDQSASSGGAWGTITGTLANQTDLQSELDGKKATFSENTAFNKNFGTGSSDVCVGNDSRLSDDRDPTAHASEHTDGTDDIQNATTSQKGLMTATQATKLDGISASAEVNTDANIWESAGTISATPSTTTTITQSGLDTSLLVEGAGIKFVNGANTRRAIVVSYTSNVLTIRLGMFDTGNTVTSIAVCNPSEIKFIDMGEEGKFAGVAHDDLHTDWGRSIIAPGGWTLGRVRAAQGSNDSGTGTMVEAKYNVVIGGSDAFTADIALTTTTTDATQAVTPANCKADALDVLDNPIVIATSDGTPNNDADGFVCQTWWIPE